MKTISKNLLTTISLGLLLTTSSLSAEQINVNKADVEQLLNTYYDICQSTTRETWNKNLEAMKKIVEDPRTASMKLSVCDDIFKTAEKNKKKYKGELDITRKLKIIKIRKNDMGSITVLHDIFAYQDSNYLLPNGKRPIGVTTGESINITPLKNSNGTIRWTIEGTYDR